jgi:hypothetical protein
MLCVFHHTEHVSLTNQLEKNREITKLTVLATNLALIYHSLTELTEYPFVMGSLVSKTTMRASK